jgi:hypothetical protein
MYLTFSQYSIIISCITNIKYNIFNKHLDPLKILWEIPKMYFIVKNPLRNSQNVLYCVKSIEKFPKCTLLCKILWEIPKMYFIVQNPLRNSQNVFYCVTVTHSWYNNIMSITILVRHERHINRFTTQTLLSLLLLPNTDHFKQVQDTLSLSLSHST